MQGEKRVAEGSDGRDGIHDLVRQYARQAYPGIDFLVVQLAVDIVDSQDAHMFLLQRHFRNADRKVHVAAFVGKGYLVLVARLYVLYDGFQVLVYAGKLAHVRENGQSEQPQSFVVRLVDHAVVIEHDDAGIDAVHDQLVVFLFLDGIRLGLEKNLRDAVERSLTSLSFDERPRVAYWKA